MKEKAIQIIAIATFGVVFILALVVGVDRSDKAECYKWQNEATKIQGFYLTENEAEQCAYQGVTVTAPILKK